MSARDGEAPQRIQRSRAKGWRMPEGAVYVGRPTIWGNPWMVGDPGRVLICRTPPLDLRLKAQVTRAGAVDRYRRWLVGEFGDIAGDTHRAYGLVLVPEWRREVLARLPELRGRDLACWCPLDGRPCHADVLLELANR